MKFRLFFVALVSVLSQAAFGTGLPVVDTNAMFQDMSDSIYTLNAVEDLLTEFNVTSNDMKALIELKNELARLADDLHFFKDTYGDLQDLSNPYVYKGRILADYITQVTQYVRKVKRLLVMAQSMRNRPQALTAVLSMVREQRERSKDQYEAAMRAMEEKEKVSTERSKVRRRIEARQKLDSEYSLIASNKSQLPISTAKMDFEKKRSSLW